MAMKPRAILPSRDKDHYMHDTQEKPVLIV